MFSRASISLTAVMAGSGWLSDEEEEEEEEEEEAGEPGLGEGSSAPVLSEPLLDDSSINNSTHKVVTNADLVADSLEFYVVVRIAIDLDCVRNKSKPYKYMLVSIQYLSPECLIRHV